MEAFGLILAVPFTLLTSCVFCLLMIRAFRRFPRLRFPVLIAASIIVCSAALEIGLSLAFGPLLLHQRFERIHSALHLMNFLLAPPALASLILIAAIRSRVHMYSLQELAIVVCWFSCVGALICNIAVDEAINGGDGACGPSDQISAPSSMNLTSPHPALPQAGSAVRLLVSDNRHSAGRMLLRTFWV